MKYFVCLTAITFCSLVAAEDGVDRVSVPLSDPSRPARVHVQLLNGGVTVKGYAGKEVVVEAHMRGGAQRERGPRPDHTEGMHRIDSGNAGLSVEEADNVVEVKTRGWSQTADLTLQVPYSSSLKLKTVNDGDISVEGVNGDIEAEDLNGRVTLNKISGSALVNALNGKIVASFARVAAEKAMSFSSLNGDIDVTFPGDLKANVRIKTDNGESFSDFDIKLEANRKPITEDGRRGDGKYRVRFEGGTRGTINGGGPGMQFTTLNGNIYIRKLK